MLSDDTEQSSLVVEAYMASGGDVDRFQRELARRLRNWFWAIPAGVGLATVRACLRLTFGVKPALAGVNSAGNGAAMRAPILGTLIPRNRDALYRFVRASSSITHRDPRAIDGAWAVALAAAESKNLTAGRIEASDVLAAIGERCESEEWRKVLDLIAERLGNSSAGEFAAEIAGKDRVGGYVMHSVPVALFIWLSHLKEPQVGLETAIRLGGDTDTTGAMLGGLYGAALGEHAFPTPWVEGIWDWPRSREYLKELADMAETPGEVKSVTWAGSVARNAFFLAVVLGHGLRRLLP